MSTYQMFWKDVHSRNNWLLESRLVFLHRGLLSYSQVSLICRFGLNLILYLACTASYLFLFQILSLQIEDAKWPFISRGEEKVKHFVWFVCKGLHPFWGVKEVFNCMIPSTSSRQGIAQVPMLSGICQCWFCLPSAQTVTQPVKAKLFLL